MGWLVYGPALFDFLQSTFPTRCYVYENFRLRTEQNFKGKGHYTKQWDPVITCRAIGAIELAAHVRELPVVQQTPNDMATAATAWNIPMRMSDKTLQHPMDSIAHGRFYAWKHLGFLPPDNLKPVKLTEPPAARVVVLDDGYGGIRKAMKTSKKRAKGLP